MLNNTLVTNEVKDSTGSELEFTRLSTGPGRSCEFALNGENPQQTYRLKINHQETGTSTKQRRRSVVRFDKTVIGVSGNPVTISAYTVCDFPIGDITDPADFEHVLANLMSFTASTGASTTILYTGTGTGAQALLLGQI